MYSFFRLRDSVITDKKQPLFEIVQKRPAHWPPLEVYPSLSPAQDTIGQCKSYPLFPPQYAPSKW